MDRPNMNGPDERASRPAHAAPDGGEARPEGGYARMPESAPDPVAGATPGMTPVDDLMMSTPRAAQQFDPWQSARGGLEDGSAVVGYGVEAIDGHAGRVSESTARADGYLVVETGRWVFGKQVMLPARTVNHVDTGAAKVYVDQTKSQVKHAPRLNEGPGGGYDTRQPRNDHSAWGDSRDVG